MTAPDFSEITGGEVESGSSDSDSRSRTEQKQIHIKGRYGTTTLRNDEGCHVCMKNSDKVILVGYVETGYGAEWDEEIQVCEHHVGDVLGDLEVDSDKIEIKEF